MDTAPFSAVSAITPTDRDDVFVADVHPLWTIDTKPNGGYLLAMLGRAAVASTEHETVLAASAHYISPPDPGPIEISTTVLRGGRRASQVRAQIHQDGRLCVEALITTSVAPDPDAKPFWSDGLPAFDVVPFDRAVRIPGVTPTGLPVPIMEQVDLRIDPATLGFAAGRPSGGGELRGWLELSGGESFDSFSLLYAVDAYPPATLEVEVTGWVPTFELTVYVRAMPAPGPVQVLQKARLIDGQKVDEACFVWDSTGRLVAQATQLAGIRLG
ncbi:MAG TPA: thioesterase family protein [Jatrophihabitantaceae bacterium]|nr:thioesterase family protein [Jatrophihabitantaceae bacterium]